MLHNVSGVYDLRPLESIATGLVKAHDFVFGGFGQRTHQITQGTFEAQLPLDLPCKRPFVEQYPAALRGREVFDLGGDYCRIDRTRIQVRCLAQEDTIDYARLRSLP